MLLSYPYKEKVVISDLFSWRFLNTGQNRENSVLIRIESRAGTDFWQSLMGLYTGRTGAKTMRADFIMW